MLKDQWFVFHNGSLTASDVPGQSLMQSELHYHTYGCQLLSQQSVGLLGKAVSLANLYFR